MHTAREWRRNFPSSRKFTNGGGCLKGWGKASRKDLSHPPPCGETGQAPTAPTDWTGLFLVFWFWPNLQQRTS